MRTLALTLVPLFLPACGQEPPTSAVQPNLSVTESTDEMYRLVGQGNWYDRANPDILIQAIRHFDGRVTGEVRDPIAGAGGPVIGVTPPSLTYPYWCLELDYAGDFVVLVYVKDNDGQTALDEVATNGDFGISCAQYPVPPDPFFPLLSGDYQGMVRTR